MGLASRTKVQFNSEMNLDCSSLEPGSAPFGELRQLSDLWNSEYPRVELSRFSLAARGHRQLHVFDSEDRCHSRTLASATCLITWRLWPMRPLRSRPCGVKTVAFLEQLQCPLHIAWLLQQPLRIPLATRRAEEVTTVYVNSAGQAPDRIGHRVDDVAAQRKSVPFAERLGTRSLDSPAGLIRHTPPQDVVFAARVYPDDGPHVVVVGHHGHARAPNDIEDREILGTVERLNLGAAGFAQRPENRVGRLDRAGYDLADRLLARSSSCRHDALILEVSKVKHGPSSLHLRITKRSLTHLISAQQQRRRDREAEPLGRFEIDHQLQPCRLLDGKVAP